MSIHFWPALQQVSGGASGSPVAISRDSQWTIAVVDTGASGGATYLYAELPSGCDVGDVVEVHYVNGNTAVISAPSGESLVGGGTLSAPRVFRKIDSSLWSYFR